MRKHTFPTLVISILGLLCTADALAQKSPSPERLEAGRAAAKVYREVGAGALAKHLASIEDPSLMVGACSDVARFFYWKQKDVSAAAAFLGSGLRLGLGRVATIGMEDPEKAKALLAQVKGLAYDLGSFTWPGWNEPGLAISTERRKAGMAAAKTNLDLAVKLEKDAGPMSAAWWLVGAHSLAARETEAALKQFLNAKEQAVEAKKPLEALMTDGYIGITLVVHGDADGKTHLRKAIGALEADGSDDATFYAEQLRAAFKVFCGAAAGVGGWRSREFKGDGFRVSVHLSRTAALFHSVGRMPAANPEDERILRQFAELRRQKEPGSGLEETLYSNENLEDALFAGVAAEHITQEEMISLRWYLLHFAPRVDESGDRHRESLVVALESLDGARITEVAERSATSQGAEKLTLDCFLVPGRDKGSTCEAYGTQAVIQVASGEDVTDLLRDLIVRVRLDLAKREAEERDGK